MDDEDFGDFQSVTQPTTLGGLVGMASTMAPETTTGTLYHTTQVKPRMNSVSVDLLSMDDFDPLGSSTTLSSSMAAASSNTPRNSASMQHSNNIGSMTGLPQPPSTVTSMMRMGGGSTISTPQTNATSNDPFNLTSAMTSSNNVPSTPSNQNSVGMGNTLPLGQDLLSLSMVPTSATAPSSGQAMVTGPTKLQSTLISAFPSTAATISQPPTLFPPQAPTPSTAMPTGPPAFTSPPTSFFQSTAASGDVLFDTNTPEDEEEDDFGDFEQAPCNPTTGATTITGSRTSAWVTEAFPSPQLDALPSTTPPPFYRLSEAHLALHTHFYRRIEGMLQDATAFITALQRIALQRGPGAADVVATTFRCRPKANRYMQGVMQAWAMGKRLRASQDRCHAPERAKGDAHAAAARHWASCEKAYQALRVKLDTHQLKYADVEDRDSKGQLARTIGAGDAVNDFCQLCFSPFEAAEEASVSEVDPVVAEGRAFGRAVQARVMWEGKAYQAICLNAFLEWQGTHDETRRLPARWHPMVQDDAP